MIFRSADMAEASVVAGWQINPRTTQMSGEKFVWNDCSKAVLQQNGSHCKSHKKLLDAQRARQSSSSRRPSPACVTSCLFLELSRQPREEENHGSDPDEVQCKRCHREHHARDNPYHHQHKSDPKKRMFHRVVSVDFPYFAAGGVSDGLNVLKETAGSTCCRNPRRIKGYGTS